MRGETSKLTRIVPPVWLLITMVLMYFASGFVPIYFIMPMDMMTWGQVIVFFGFSITYYAARMFRKAKTPLKPFVPVQKVITDGPFRYTRNPVYLGMFMMLTGWAIYLRALSPWFFVVAFIWLIRTHWVLKEEVQMEREMGEAYLKYKNEVRRWL